MASWVGKKVKAIRGTAILKTGSINTVAKDYTDARGDRLHITELNLDYPKEWFELVNPSLVGKMVKCVDPSHALVKNQVYKVVRHDPDPGGEDIIYVDGVFSGGGTSGNLEGFFASRFEVVGKAPASYASVAAHAVSKGLVDPEEERCWAAMKPSRASNECACGILQSLCQYHS